MQLKEYFSTIQGVGGPCHSKQGRRSGRRCFCTTLIREPNLPNRWLAGDRRPATCISCNGCFKPGIKEGGIYCVQDKARTER